jgi:sigma-B regulation protein RsbU (phosphoserine phosphatase)
MLISVFSIAALHSIRVSALYLVIIISAVSLYLINTQPEGVEDAFSFLQVALLLTLPTWFFANDLRNSRDRAKRLTQALENSVLGLDNQAKQLQQIAEIGRVATASLEREQLLGNVVDLIQKRFNFYYVGVLLISPDGARLALEEASGETGRLAYEEGHHLTMGHVSIVGWVAINRKARIALDVGDDPHFFSNPNLPETHSEVALPLIARGRLLGVLDVQSREINAFQEEDIAALQVMADQIASGLYNARLFNDISNQALVLTDLQSVTNLMNQQANTRNALNVLVETIPALFNADGGGVFLYEPKENVLKLMANLNAVDERIGRSLAPGEGLSGWAFKENKTHAIENYTTWAGRSEKYAQGGFHAAVAIPLRRQNEPLGVLTLTRSAEGQPFLQDEIQIAELLAAQVAAVIINNQLIEETRRLVQRERTINQATDQIRRRLDAKTILDTTTAELGNLLTNKVVRARLYAEEAELPKDEARS